MHMHKYSVLVCVCAHAYACSVCVCVHVFIHKSEVPKEARRGSDPMELKLKLQKVVSCPMCMLVTKLGFSLIH